MAYCFDGVSTHVSGLAAAGADTPRHLAEHLSAFAGMVHLSKWRSGDIGGFKGRRQRDAPQPDDTFAEVCVGRSGCLQGTAFAIRLGGGSKSADVALLTSALRTAPGFAISLSIAST